MKNRYLSAVCFLASLLVGWAQQNSSPLNVSREFEARAAVESLPEGTTAFNFDAAGRLWVVAPDEKSEFYTGPAKTCQVLVYELQEGKAGAPKVFGNYLKPITSFVFYGDGIMAAQGAQIIWLRDKNRNGSVDVQEVVYSGFGTNDPSGMVDHLRWGLDGWIYAAQNNRAGEITNNEGKKLGSVGGSVFRFKPNGKGLEKVAYSAGRISGLDVAWDGEIFFTQARAPHLQHIMLEECYLERGRLAKTTSSKAIEDHRTLFSATGEKSAAGLGERAKTVTGLTIYDGGVWPLKYDGVHFMAEPSMHLVHEDIVLPLVEGLGYEATRRQEGEFITGDAAFHPRQLQVGPDGALYILDKGPEGRAPKLWRVQHHYARKATAEDLTKATVEQLVQKLEHPNKMVRLAASQRLMEERRAELVPALSNLLHTARLPYARLHALWGLYHLGGLSETNLVTAIADKHPAVQKNAFRMVVDFQAPTNSVLEKALTRILEKELDNRSKLRVILAFGKPGLSKEGRGALMKASAGFKDSWARSAALSVLKSTPLESLKAAFGSDKADSLKDFVGIIAEDIAFTENKRLAAEIVKILGAPKNAPSDVLKATILDSFGRYLTPGFVPEWSEELGKALRALMNSQSQTVRYATFPVAVHWDSEGVLATKIQTVKKEFFSNIDSTRVKTDDHRAKLTTSLMRVPAWQKDVIPLLDQLLDTKMGEPIQKHLLSLLANAQHPSGTAAILRRYPKIGADSRGLAIYPLLRSPERSKALLESMGKKGFGFQEVGPQVLNVLLHYPDAEVAAKAKSIVESALATNQGIVELSAELEKPGDSKKAKDHFLQNCGLCHKIGKEGKEIGPDVSFLALASAETWRKEVLESGSPSTEAERVYFVFTKKGDIFFGSVLRQTSDGILLRNWQEDREIHSSQIEKVQSGNFSLMPQHLNLMPAAVLRDIATFIKSSVGKGT